jgi:hypothetical protein
LPDEFGWTEHGGSLRIVVERVAEPRTLTDRRARDFDVDPVPGNSILVRFDLEETADGTRADLAELVEFVEANERVRITEAAQA